MSSHHPRRSHQQWQPYIDKFKNQSELTQQQFCQKEGLTLGTFRKHLYRSQSRTIAGTRQNPPQPKPAPSTGNFGSVAIEDTPRSPIGNCLELPGNIRLHTQSMPTAEYLHSLVKVLRHGH